MSDTGPTVTSVLASIGEIFAELLSHFSTVLELVVTEPVLMIMFGIMVTGAIIGLSFRVMRRG